MKTLAFLLVIASAGGFIYHQKMNSPAMVAYEAYQEHATLNFKGGYLDEVKYTLESEETLDNETVELILLQTASVVEENRPMIINSRHTVTMQHRAEGWEASDIEVEELGVQHPSLMDWGGS